MITPRPTVTGVLTSRAEATPSGTTSGHLVPVSGDGDRYPEAVVARFALDPERGR